jgi:DNA-directed RNA polymerase specialized sigma24 family protein
MDANEAEKFRRRAKLSATRKGFAEDSDDLAQEVLLNWLEGGGQHQTVDYAVIDAIRRDRGDSRNGQFEPRKRERRPHCELKEFHSVDQFDESRGDFERITSMLKGGRRAVAVLFFEWGLTQKEIGGCFGVTESAVCNWLRQIEDVLRGKLAKENLLNKCANLECHKPAAPGWKYCSAACAPGAKYSNADPMKAKPVATIQAALVLKVEPIDKPPHPCSLVAWAKARYEGQAISDLTYGQVANPDEHFEIEEIEPVDSHEDVSGFELEAFEL